MKRFFKLLGENRRSFFLALAVGLVFSAIGVAVPTISGKLINAVVSRDSQWGIAMGAFLLVSGLQILFNLLDAHVGNRFAVKQKQMMRKKGFSAFAVRDHGGREEISAFVSFVNNDIPDVTEQYFQGTIDMAKCGAILLLSALSLLYIHWSLALIIVGVSLLIVFLPNTMRKQGARPGSGTPMPWRGTIRYYSRFWTVCGLSKPTAAKALRHAAWGRPRMRRRTANARCCCASSWCRG